MKSISLRLPDSLHRQLKTLAEREGVSMNRLVTIAVAEKTAALLTLNYFEEHTARDGRAKFEAALGTVPDVEPAENDRLLA